MANIGDRRRYLPKVDMTASSAYTDKLSFRGTRNLGTDCIIEYYNKHTNTEAQRKKSFIEKKIFIEFNFQFFLL